MSELSDEMKARIEDQVRKAIEGGRAVDGLLRITAVMREFAESRSQIAVLPEEREQARETVKRLQYRESLLKTYKLIKE